MSNSPREPSKIVEDICWRFECAWKDATCPKQRPRVEDFLREAPEAKRDQLLVELVGLDVDYRRAQGEVPQTQEYRERFPSIDRAWLDRLLPTAATIASDAPRPNPNVRSDHNLLLGILAYQNAFITREALFAAMQAWLYDKAKSLADILQNQGALDGEERVLLEALVRRHLKQNDDDPQKSLQAVNSISSVRDELEQLPDPALQASIAHLSKGRPDDDATATRSYSAGESTSQGTRFRILRPHAKGGLGQVWHGSQPFQLIHWPNPQRRNL